MIRKTPSFRGHIDLRKEHEYLMKEYGHYVLLQRTNRKFRCRCWNEAYREADSNCKYCAGTGYIFRIERHEIRRDHASQIVARPALLGVTGIGDTHVDAKVFWMSHDSNPVVGDRIYEVGWRGNKPTHIIAGYEISDVEDKRSDDGRIEYHYVTSNKQVNVTNVESILVRKWRLTENYEFIYKGD